MTRIRLLAYTILDGTLIPIDRVADQKPYYSGKHHRHVVNVGVIADPAGRLVWASSALPGSSHETGAVLCRAALPLVPGATSGPAKSTIRRRDFASAGAGWARRPSPTHAQCQAN